MQKQWKRPTGNFGLVQVINSCSRSFSKHVAAERQRSNSRVVCQVGLHNSDYSVDYDDDYDKDSEQINTDPMREEKKAVALVWLAWFRFACYPNG